MRGDNNTTHYLKNIKRRYRIMRSGEVILWSMATALLIFFSARLVLNGSLIAMSISVLVGLIVGYVVAQKIHLFDLEDKQFAFYLNRHYPILRESADLLLKKNEELTTIQQLQKIETVQRIEDLYPAIKLPHQIGKASFALAISIIASTLLTSFLKPFDGSRAAEKYNRLHPVEKKFLPPTITSCVISISPPAYTQIKRYNSTNFDIQFPEASKIKWSITFDIPVSDVAIILSAKDTIPLLSNDSQYAIEQSFTESGFYQLTWKNAYQTSHFSDFYKLAVIADMPPFIQILHPAQHLELSPGDKKILNLSATISDDHGLAASTIVATVSKGSGEAVKFREEKLKFDKPVRISGGKINASRTLDLDALGLAPGDELYFYIEAFDNKTPHANRTRTETYFITLQDTTEMTTSVEASLGVDLMPEYFRSQRQIIIDSEKLLSEKKRISKQNFSERSNELGYDQKVLRLRYGEFLGEEFESSIGPTRANENDDPGVAVQKNFGHDHDNENEHNLVDERNQEEPDHQHDPPTSSGNKSDVLDEFVHAHDGDEEATFFVQSIKAKLKAAVTIMWDAELYLRLYQPEKSLPYQYKALKLLKEISQDSRIYVHRTGFDPPPLKEDRRLTGDLSEVRNSISKVELHDTENRYPAIIKAIALIENLIDHQTINLSETAKKLLTDAGREVATLEMQQPGRYLKTLSWLSEIIQYKVNENERIEILKKIRYSLWNALPQESRTPASTSEVIHELDRKFLDNLGAR